MMGTAHTNDPLAELRSLATALVDDAPRLDTDSLHLIDGSPVPRRPHRFTVPAIAVMSVAAMLIVAEVSVAFVANSAVPGDRIYGIDLLVEDALIAVGVTVDKSPERIEEAEVLLERNELDQAIRTARVGYQEMDPAVAGAAVLRLVEVERALATSADPAIEAGVRTAFTDLLAATKSKQALDGGVSPDINAAALRVARAANGIEEAP